MACNNATITGAFNLGCFPHCGEIELPIVACKTGIHTISSYNKGMFLSNDFFAIAGENIVIQNIFNECAPVEFQIYQEDGELYTHQEIDSDTNEIIGCYDRFCLTIKIALHVRNVNCKNKEKLTSKPSINQE